ncbi:bifunctional enoyl-CoA hydratase/phosphate acetyltransferase [Pseudothermotoga thermarum]|uniref:Phosphate butyryltransferase n=1 Tax=Pseudothermotoga thermarum DSM 5069 TaxID=688269 RepID=F7YYM0_9THEM|nr:bifunctional enoyl-CoA hydratase/phosphate acetyltransferase [Pseudothermotoga thermarum]AEH51052.1 phosphate butyryltransferase [Pseudothermotoga thermarum DSM 5069]
MKTLKEFFEKASKSSYRRAVVAGAEDAEAVKAAFEAVKMGILDDVTLVGNKEIVSCEDKNFSIIHASTEAECAETSVKLISSGKADILIKGLVKTSTLLKAVLNKEWGLRGSGLLSHIAAVEVPYLPKVVFITDGGIVIRPTLEQKITIIKNAVKFLHSIGYESPKVAIVCAVETVNPDMPETVEAAVLAKMGQRGEFGRCLVDGPLGLDNALNLNAAKVKGVKSDVAGDADLLVVPDIHAGNLLGKSAVYFAGGKIAGIVIGAKAPVVLVSRADTFESKLFSIAMAVSYNQEM